MSEKLPPKILVIEHDKSNSYSVSNTIERSRFDVYRASSEENAIELVLDYSPNVVVINSEVKEISISTICTKLRELMKPINLPVILLVDEKEAAEGDLPTDDLAEVMIRPFTPFQLTTKIKSLLRRSQPIFQDKLIKYKDVSLNLATYKVFKGQQAIHLGPTEFKILQLFLQYPRVIFSRQYIINYVWGKDKNIEPRTVDVHVNRLRTIMNPNRRKKNIVSENTRFDRAHALKIDSYDNLFIKTVRASGYCLSLPGEIT
ncbi:MAG: DNA-binding response regulator [Rickettsiaceae bacterium]|nr:MAG: DNA-binding response regulator [Rickettsiaceae bacterium]